jgi:hypothetical protein
LRRSSLARAAVISRSSVAALVDEHGVAPAIDAEHGALHGVGVLGPRLGARTAASAVGADADVGLVELVLVLVVARVPPGHASICSQSFVNCGRVFDVEPMSSTTTPGPRGRRSRRSSPCGGRRTRATGRR